MDFVKLWRITKKFSPIIFSTLAVGGSVATPILAIKAAKKLPENPTKKDILKAYKWAIASEVVTVGSIAASTGISWKRTTDLTKIAVASSRNLAQLAAGTATGFSAAQLQGHNPTDIQQLPAKDENAPKELWYDVQMDHWFEASQTDVLWAMYYSLGYFTEHGELLLKDFYHSMDATPPENIKGIGWYADEEWYLDWESYALSFDYDREPVEDGDGRKYRRLWYEQPPKFYEDLYF